MEEFLAKYFKIFFICINKKIVIFYSLIKTIMVKNLAL